MEDQAYNKTGRDGMTAAERQALYEQKHNPEAARIEALERRIQALELNPVKAGQGISVNGNLVSLGSLVDESEDSGNSVLAEFLEVDASTSAVTVVQKNLRLA